MSTKITSSHLHQRLLVTEHLTGISLQEVEVLELSPNTQHVKLLWNVSNRATWCRVEEYDVVEVLGCSG